jgi:hypothetical protein
MTSSRVVWLSSMLAPLCLALPLAGCGDDGSSTTETTTSTTSTTGATGGGGMGGAGGAGGEGGTMTSSTTTSTSTSTGTPMIYPVTFRYRPQWPGVTKVDVVGGFGQPGDWSSATPLVSLADDGTGTWTATVDLVEGEYLYMYRVFGDDDAPADFKRYALDQQASITIPCPEASPTHTETSNNPCSLVKVPQDPPAQLFPITGKVLYGGAPVAGYLVQVDSDETAFSPYFMNRSDTKDDGTFSLEVPTGMFRIQVQHPTYLTQSDVERDPYTLLALRRNVSTAFYVGAPVELLDSEMEYPDYDMMMPTGAAMLPTTFEVTLLPGADEVRVGVYGTANGTGTTVGTQWFLSPQGGGTSIPFDGAFNTTSALQANVVPGEQYYWGTFQYRSAGVGKSWRGQSMVLPIVWQ